MAGCGSSSSDSKARTGQLVLTVIWPERSRLIPLASNSIRATLSSGETVLGTQVLPRPVEDNQTTVTFQNLPPGNANLVATAYPNTDATGVAQATGSAPVTIVAGQTAEVTVTMASTIDRLEISPANPSVPVGQTVQLTATAFDRDNNIVLILAGNLQWVSGTPANATVSANGLLSGVAVGTSQITVAETESGKSAITTATVAAAAPPTNTGPLRSAVDPTGKFLYVADNLSRTVSQFKINADGTLSPLSPPTVSVALPPSSILANPAPGSHTLYVGATDNTNGAIYQFNINPDGTLTMLTPATPASTSQPLELLIDPAGKFLFAIDHNEGIRQFTINANGTLTQNGPDVTTGQLFAAAITTDGKYLYTSGGPRQYRINPDGTLSLIGVLSLSSGTEEGMCTNPAGPYLYVTFSPRAGGGGGIDVYTINANGTLTKNGLSVPFSQFAFQCAVTPDGKYLYVVALNTPDNVVAQYAINANGTITPLSPPTVPAGSFTTSVTVSPDGKYLYVTNNKDNTISQFRINADGTLRPLSPPNVNG
jgi:6-phosphogluconolactonase (cycloisomerase 2 family)